jgi:hypothetical protein
MKQVIIILIFLMNSFNCYPQLLDNALFRIYRAESILGTVTHLRLDKNNLYSMTISEIDCSLCDHKELSNLIESKGTWNQNKDSIILQSETGKITSLEIINDSLLRPTYAIGYELDSKKDTTSSKIVKNILLSHMQDFHLIYDTYPNGVARFMIDKYRMMRAEYEIELRADGTLEKIRYYWDNKQTKRIR